MGMKASKGVWVSEPGPNEQDELTAEPSAGTKHRDTKNAKNRIPKWDSEKHDSDTEPNRPLMLA